MKPRTNKKPCTNNTITKGAEVADAMKRFGNYDGMAELYQRGCFRHVEDVAYARIAREKYKEPIDKIALYLDDSYGPHAISHRCDRVYPPS